MKKSSIRQLGRAEKQFLDSLEGRRFQPSKEEVLRLPKLYLDMIVDENLRGDYKEKDELKQRLHEKLESQYVRAEDLDPNKLRTWYRSIIDLILSFDDIVEQKYLDVEQEEILRDFDRKLSELPEELEITSNLDNFDECKWEDLKTAGYLSLRKLHSYEAKEESWNDSSKNLNINNDSFENSRDSNVRMEA